MKKTNLLLVGLVIVSAVFAFYPQLHKLYKSSAQVICELNDQFKTDTGITAGSTNSNLINNSGTVHYFKDDFSSYQQYSKTIDQFDNLDNISLSGSFQEIGLSPENISGEKAFSFQIKPNVDQNKDIVIRKKLAQPMDIVRWKESGIFSFWMNIENRKGISGVSLKIGDENNNFRDYKELNNYQIEVPNNYDSDDVYPDVPLSNDPNNQNEWTDYWLNEGWNYIFWKENPGSFSDNGNVDLAKITWFEITLVTSNNVSQKIMLDDFRIQDGIQKEANSLGGVWYPPENKPQFGIFDLDQLGENKYAARLINVRHTQYPNNGDHGRMVLNYNTPQNFSLRARFQLTNLPKTQKERENTWFRVLYDFDSAYDTGNDWFGAFISFEWNKFGLTTVNPIEKDNIQTWEPRKEAIMGASSDFTPKENVIYEIQITGKGQNAIASIYEVENNCLILRGKINYGFQRSRHGDDKRYPFCLEVTGNLKANILEFEVKEL